METEPADTLPLKNDTLYRISETLAKHLCNSLPIIRISLEELTEEKYPEITQENSTTILFQALQSLSKQNHPRNAQMNLIINMLRPVKYDLDLNKYLYACKDIESITETEDLSIIYFQDVNVDPQYCNKQDKAKTTHRITRELNQITGAVDMEDQIRKARKLENERLLSIAASKPLHLLYFLYEQMELLTIAFFESKFNVSMDINKDYLNIKDKIEQICQGIYGGLPLGINTKFPFETDLYTAKTKLTKKTEPTVAKAKDHSLSRIYLTLTEIDRLLSLNPKYSSKASAERIQQYAETQTNNATSTQKPAEPEPQKELIYKITMYTAHDDTDEKPEWFSVNKDPTMTKVHPRSPLIDLYKTKKGEEVPYCESKAKQLNGITKQCALYMKGKYASTPIITSRDAGEDTFNQRIKLFKIRSAVSVIITTTKKRKSKNAKNYQA